MTFQEPDFSYYIPELFILEIKSNITHVKIKLKTMFKIR